MIAVTAVSVDPRDPVACVSVADVQLLPPTPEEWVTVHVKAASLNHHDLWNLRGPAPGPLPMILGTDAAGITEDGQEVIVHAVIADERLGRGDEASDPARTLLSDWHPGTLAEAVRVPRRNLVPKPAELTWAEAACLPTAWLTAFRMLTTHGSAAPGETVLVQGAAGGVATAAVVLAKSMGLRVWVTSRDSGKRQWIVSKGADQAFAPDEELPAPVDLVVETVGEPTWNHSVGSVRAGGRIVVSGFTGGRTPEFDLLPLIVKALTIRGTLMGTATELAALSRFLVDSHARPIIDSVLPMTQTAVGLRRLEAGAVRGKVVIVPDRFL